MEWQLVLTWSLIALASAFVVWRGVKTWGGMKTGCAGGCGCAKTPAAPGSEPALIPPERLVLRARHSKAGEPGA